MFRDNSRHSIDNLNATELKISEGTITSDPYSLVKLIISNYFVKNLIISETMGNEDILITGTPTDLFKVNSKYGSNKINLIGDIQKEDTEKTDKSTISNEVKTLEVINLGQCHAFIRSITVNNNLKLSHIKKDSDLVFKKVSFQRSCMIKITDSELDNSKFYNLDLSKCNISILDSNLEKSFFSEVNWPIQITSHDHYFPDQISKIHTNSLENKNLDYEFNNIQDLNKMRNIYRQLKNNYISRHDTVMALKFYHKEMESLEKLTKNFDEKITLKLSNFLSKHGTSWIRPLIFLILTSIFHFIYLNYTKPLCSAKNIYQCIWKNTKDILLLIDITNKPISGNGDGISVIFKILSALLIYNIIVAFRKFSRKF